MHICISVINNNVNQSMRCCLHKISAKGLLIIISYSFCSIHSKKNRPYIYINTDNKTRVYNSLDALMKVFLYNNINLSLVTKRVVLVLRHCNRVEEILLC